MGNVQTHKIHIVLIYISKRVIKKISSSKKPFAYGLLATRKQKVLIYHCCEKGGGEGPSEDVTPGNSKLKCNQL
jgi:hypothetical protein